MKNKLIRFWIFLLSMTTMSLNVNAIEKETKFYDPWIRLSTDELMDKAGKFLDNEKSRDNALIIYTIVANRYKSSLDYKEKEQCINAIHNLGCLFLTSYNGYPLAYSNLKKAETLAEQIGYVQPNIYLNLGNIYTMSDNALKTRDIQDMALWYFQKAFDLAAKEKNEYTLFTSYYDILWIGCLSNREDIITKATDRFLSLKGFGNSQLGKFSLSMAKAFQGEIKGKNRQVEEAYAKASQQIIGHPEDYSFHVHALAVLAKLTMQKDTNKALQLFLQARKIAGSHHDDGLITWLTKECSEAFRITGNPVIADRYKMEYLERKDAEYEFTQERTLKQMRFLDQLGQADKRIDRITKEKQLLNIGMIIAISVAALFLAMFLLLFVVYRRLRQKQLALYEKTQDLLKKEQKEKEKPVAPSADSIRIKDKIDVALEDVELFCNPNLTLKQLSEKINEKYWLVSQVINEQYGVNFNQLLADRRIKEVCRRFHDKDAYARFTIEAMALSVGFKSRSNFVQVFKRMVGLTPSEYQRMALRKS